MQRESCCASDAASRSQRDPAAKGLASQAIGHSSRRRRESSRTRLHGRPEIFNTDQGSQFTAKDFTDVLKRHDVAISMDGKGRWMDNVFVERLWRSVKYEDIYLRAYETPAELRAGLRRYFEFYNSQRAHSGLSNQTPDEVYFGMNGGFAEAA